MIRNARDGSRLPRNSGSISAAIYAGDVKGAVSQHPLRHRASQCVRAALRDVTQTTLGTTSLLSALPNLKGNVGSMVGTLFEYYLEQHIRSEGFISQQAKYDCDFIYPADRVLDFEVKTSSHKHHIFGNRSAAAAREKRDGSFLLAVNYDKNTLLPVVIRFGWVSSEHWIPQTGNGQQSRLSTDAVMLAC